MPDKLTDVPDNKVGKITDSEIIKALECCAINRNCKGCYLYTHEVNDMCPRVLMQNTLDLINRLQAENERLRNHIQDGIDLAKQIPEMMELAKAEAYKEFAKLLCEIWQRYEDENISGIYVPKWVMLVYKELVGEDK